MSNLSSQLAEAELALSNQWEARCIYTSHHSALRLRDELRAMMLTQISGLPADQSNSSQFCALVQSPSGATLAAAAEMVNLIEGDERMMGQIKTFGEILAKRDALAAEVATAKSIADSIEGERLEALEAAKSEAFAKLEIEFAASPESEPIDSKPFRGRVKPKSEAELAAV